jgi:peptidoglycan/LPS O-acetylase OafA/YrhL
VKHIKGLDTLRAFAVLFVIIQHWGPPFDDRTPIGNFVKCILLPNGADSVYVFFVLSGFLITSILLKAKMNDQRSNRGVIVKNFIARRIFRIFPIYYLTLFSLFFFFDHGISENLSYFTTYTLNIKSFNANHFISCFAHSWTLSVEEQFYLFWPWLIIFINDKYLKHLFVASIIIGMVSTYITLEMTHHIEPFLVTDCLDSFGIGGLYAYICVKGKHRSKFEKMIKVIVPVFFLIRLFWNTCFYLVKPLYGICWAKSVDSIIAIWLIIVIINNRSEVVRKYLLENRFLNFIGKISYGIYIYHIYIVYIDAPWIYIINDRIVYNPFLHDLFLNTGFIYFLRLFLLVLFCWGSYIFVETPIMRLKKHFTYAKRNIVTSRADVNTI